MLFKTNTKVTSSNINDMSPVMNKEIRLTDKEKGKPQSPSQKYSFCTLE